MFFPEPVCIFQNFMYIIWKINENKGFLQGKVTRYRGVLTGGNSPRANWQSPIADMVQLHDRQYSLDERRMTGGSCCG